MIFNQITKYVQNVALDVRRCLINVHARLVHTLLIIIVPYRHSIGKCFFFHRHSLLYHLLNFTLHSKANVCNIDTFIRFYMQMRMEKNPKHLAIDSIGHSHNSVHTIIHVQFYIHSSVSRLPS